MNVSRIPAIIQKLFAVAMLIMVVTCAHAQKRVRLKDADVLRSGKKGDLRYQRLIGNVVFTQNETTIH